MIKITDNITDSMARKLAMVMRVNAKRRARKAGFQVMERHGSLVARGKDGKFISLLKFMEV